MWSKGSQRDVFKLHFLQNIFLCTFNYSEYLFFINVLKMYLNCQINSKCLTISNGIF